MPTLSFRVDGYPAPYSSTTTRLWRNMIAAKAQDEKAKIFDEAIPLETLFTVSIVFEMSDPLRSDIDNLAKVVVDTLFIAKSNVPNENPMPTGILFSDIPDTHVIEVHHVKQRNAGKEGANITISW